MQAILRIKDYLRQVKEGETRVVEQNLGTGAFAKSEVPCVRLLCMANFVQRTGIAAVWAIEIRHAGTAADNCTVVDVLFNSQIYNVKPELKLIIFTAADAYNVQPKLQQYSC